MAEEQIIIDVEIKSDEAKKKTIALTQLIEKQRQELLKYRKELKASGGENQNAAAKVAELSEKIKANNKELRRAQNEANAEANSINALRSSINKLNAERNTLNTSIKEEAKRFNELTETLNKQRGELNKISKEAGSFKDNIGNYTESVKQAFRETEFFGVSIDKLELAFNQTRAVLTSSIKSLGLFRLALIATGVGAFVVVLGSLIAFFTRTQKGIDLVNRELAAFGTSASVVIDALAKIGEGLVDFISGLSDVEFSWGKTIDVITDIAKTFVDTQITLFTSLKDIIIGAVTLDSEQIEKGLNGYKELFKQIAQGAKDLANKAGVDLDKVAADAVEVNKKARQIEKERQALRDREIKSRTVIAALDREINKQREIAAKDLDPVEKQKALEKSIDLVNKRTAIQIGLKSKELELLDREQALASNLAQDDAERASLAAEIIELQARASAERRESLSQIAGIEKSERARQLKESQKLSESLTKLRQEDNEKLREKDNERLADVISSSQAEVAERIRAADTINKREQVLQEAREKRFEDEKQARADLLSASSNFFGEAAALAADSFGEQSAAARASFEIQKRLSQAQIIVAGVTEVQEIFKTYASSGPFGAILAAVQTAAAVARTANAVAQVNQTGFAKGGYTGDGGRLEPAGVVHKGEFVVSKSRVKALGGPQKLSSMTGQPMNATSRSFSGGGIASRAIENQVNANLSAQAIADAVSNVKIFAAISDINTAQTKRQNVLNIADQ